MEPWQYVLIGAGFVLLIVVGRILLTHTSEHDTDEGSDAEDAAAIWQYRAWKNQASSWSDVEMFNDMIEEKQERIARRRGGK